MNDERFLKDWLQDTTDATTDPNAAASGIVSRLHDTPQRRRWLPWLPARRRQHDDTSANGRTRLMLNPISVLAAGALTLAIGGAMLVAQPFEWGGSTIPGAATDADHTAAFFTGTLDEPTGCDGDFQEPVVEHIDGIRKSRGAVFGCFMWETTDPRLSGKSTVVWNEDTHSTFSGVLGGTIQSGRERIVNEAGSWEGVLTHLKVDEGLRLESGWYVGAGQYEGLSAYVILQDNGQSLWGYVSPEPPPVPSAIPEVQTES